MGMSSGFRSVHGVPSAEINMIPLIDVMLVLLIIFMVTAPLLTHKVRLELPQATASFSSAEVKKLEISIDAAGQVYWNGEPRSREQWLAALTALGRQAPETELQLHADRQTRYEQLADLMAAASRSGLQRIGFVTQPGETK